STLFPYTTLFRSAGASGEESRCPGQDCQPGGDSWQFEFGRRAFIGLARGQRAGTDNDAECRESTVADRLGMGEEEAAHSRAASSTVRPSRTGEMSVIVQLIRVSQCGPRSINAWRSLIS